MNAPRLLTRSGCPLCEKVKRYMTENEIPFEIVDCPNGNVNAIGDRALPLLAPLLNGGGRFPVLVFDTEKDRDVFLNDHVSPFIRKHVRPVFWWMTDKDLATWVGAGCTGDSCTVG